jgi:hypothetical protein
VYRHHFISGRSNFLFDSVAFLYHLLFSLETLLWCVFIYSRTNFAFPNRTGAESIVYGESELPASHSASFPSNATESIQPPCQIHLSHAKCHHQGNIIRFCQSEWGEVKLPIALRLLFLMYYYVGIKRAEGTIRKSKTGRKDLIWFHSIRLEDYFFWLQTQRNNIIVVFLTLIFRIQFKYIQRRG